MSVLVLSVVLFSLLWQVYLNTKKNIALQTAMIRIEENATLAGEYIAEAIHQAGYLGCPQLSASLPITPPSKITPANRLEGHDEDIIVRHAAIPFANLANDMTQLDQLTVSQAVIFNKGEELIVSDCSKAEIVRVARRIKQEKTQWIVLTAPMLTFFSREAEIAKWMIHRYFVRKTKRRDDRGEAIYALFVEDEKHHAVELVEGIRALTFRYYQQKSGSIEARSAKEIDDWSAVIGVSMQMVVVYPPLKKRWYRFFALSNRLG